jgi:hypothetical protein
VLAGSTAYSLSATNQTTVSCDYSAASFSAIVAVTATASASSSNRIDVTLNGAPGTSSASVIVRQSENVNATTSGNVYWIAVGT